LEHLVVQSLDHPPEVGAQALGYLLFIQIISTAVGLSQCEAHLHRMHLQRNAAFSIEGDLWFAK